MIRSWPVLTADWPMMHAHPALTACYFHVSIQSSAF